MKGCWIWIFLLVMLSGCSPSSMEEYRFEGESLVRSLIEECQKIESKEDLLLEKPRLKKKFDKIVDLMIAARKFQVKHLDSEIPVDLRLAASNALKEEFIRIYKIEGCQSLMEDIQRDSLHKLDLFSRKQAQLSEKNLH